MMDESEALRLAAECAFLSPMEQIMQHMGQCEVHNVLYVEINPSKPEGCPICNGRIEPKSESSRSNEESPGISDS